MHQSKQVTSSIPCKKEIPISLIMCMTIEMPFAMIVIIYLATLINTELTKS